MFGGKKDVLYSYLSQDDINWRKVIYRITYWLLMKVTMRNDHKKSKLPFEEPEARIYPLSVINVVQSVINLTNNQFFITTHSPYIIDALLEQLNDEVAIYFVDMKSGNTTV